MFIECYIKKKRRTVKSEIKALDHWVNHVLPEYHYCPLNKKKIQLENFQQVKINQGL